MNNRSLRVLSHDSGATDRLRAADALREARRRLACGGDAAEACGWALTLRPEGRAAQRSMIDWLMCSGQHDQAATTAGAALLRQPRNGRLWLRRAAALLAINRTEEAQQAIARARQLRPFDRDATLLAADIATARGEHDRALTLLNEADQRFPPDARIAHRLVRTLLACGRINDAAAVLAQIETPDSALVAAVRVAGGRLLEARESLEAARERSRDAAERDRLLTCLIDALEQAGDWPALRALSEEPALSEINAQRLATALLRMGAFQLATDLLNTHVPAHRAGALTDLACALHAAAGRTDHAMTALHNGPPRTTGSAAAQWWLAALMGGAAAEHLDPRRSRRAGADPSTGVLEGLRRWAHDVLTHAATEHDASPATGRCRALAALCDTPPADAPDPDAAPLRGSTAAELRQAA